MPIQDLFNEDGTPTDPGHRMLKQLPSMLAQLEWYAGALCFVFPSLYEGFGIPVLEAFSCGCPVAASNTSSLPEVGGDSAVYFDPQSEESIRDIVMSLTENSEYRQHLIELGRKRASYFSWQDTARKTIEVYKKALSR